MTAIVAAVSESGVLLAADSQASGWNSIRMLREPKTFQLTETIALACCGSGRFGQIVTTWLDDLLEEPYPPLGADEEVWAKRVFVPALVQCLDDHGFLHRYEEDNTVGLGDSGFLLAIRNRVFRGESDFSVDEPTYAFEAMGSGEEAAMGAMHKATDAAQNFLREDELKEIADCGVKAAIGTTAFVGGLVTYAKTVQYTADERKLAGEVLAA